MKQQLCLALIPLALVACGDDTTGSGGDGSGGASTTQTTSATTTTSTTTSGTTTVATSSTQTGGGSHCEQVCAALEAISVSLSCGTLPSCVLDCENNHAQVTPACEDELTAFEVCLAGEPETSFQCSPGKGISAFKTACTQEFEAFVACES